MRIGQTGPIAIKVLEPEEVKVDANLQTCELFLARSGANSLRPERAAAPTVAPARANPLMFWHGSSILGRLW